MKLGPLYHWSPSSNYGGISRDGLVIGSAAVTCSQPVPWISASLNPRTAWSLSGAMEWTTEHDAWDLWMIDIGDSDHIRIRAEFGPRISEVQVGNSIPPSRLWHSGRRDRSGYPLSPCPGGV